MLKTKKKLSLYGNKNKTTDTKQQRQQQIGRLIQAILSVDVDLSPYLEKYVDKYSWKWSSMPGDANNKITH